MTAFLYSFHAKSVGYYNPPFLATCDAEAKYRVAQTVLSSGNDSLEKNPESFSLCKLGSFDPATGIIEYSKSVVCDFSEIAAAIEAFKKEGD